MVTDRRLPQHGPAPHGQAEGDHGRRAVGAGGGHRGVDVEQLGVAAAPDAPPERPCPRKSSPRTSPNRLRYPVSRVKGARAVELVKPWATTNVSGRPPAGRGRGSAGGTTIPCSRTPSAVRTVTSRWCNGGVARGLTSDILPSPPDTGVDATCEETACGSCS